MDFQQKYLENESDDLPLGSEDGEEKILSQHYCTLQYTIVDLAWQNFAFRVAVLVWPVNFPVAEQHGYTLIDITRRCK